MPSLAQIISSCFGLIAAFAFVAAEPAQAQSAGTTFFVT